MGRRQKPESGIKWVVTLKGRTWHGENMWRWWMVSFLDVCSQLVPSGAWQGQGYMQGISASILLEHRAIHVQKARSAFTKCKMYKREAALERTFSSRWMCLGNCISWGDFGSHRRCYSWSKTAHAWGPYSLLPWQVPTPECDIFHTSGAWWGLLT